MSLLRFSLAAFALTAGVLPAAGQSTFRPLPRSALGRPLPAGATFGTVREASFRRPPAEPGTAEDAEDPGRLELLFGGYAIADSDLGASGEVATQRGGWSARWSRARDEHSVSLSFGTEASFYDFGRSVPITPGGHDPFNDVYETTLAAAWRRTPERGAGHLYGFELSLSGEDDAALGDALLGSGFAGATWSTGRGLDLTAGLAGVMRFEDDPWVIPFLGFDWRVSEATRFSLIGPSLRLERSFGPGVSVALWADYDLRQYRLNDVGVIPDGVFREQEVRAGATLDLGLGEDVRLELFGGAVLWRELETLDAGGAALGVAETDPAPFLGLTLSAGF